MKLKGLMAVILAVGLVAGMASVSSAALFDPLAYASTVLESSNVLNSGNITGPENGSFATFQSNSYLLAGFDVEFFDLLSFDAAIAVNLFDAGKSFSVLAREKGTNDFRSLTLDANLLVWRLYEIDGLAGLTPVFDAIKIAYETGGDLRIDAIAVVHALPPTAVPEPSTLLLLGSGLLGVVAIGRKRTK